MVDRTAVCQDRAAVYHGSFVPQGEIGGCVRRRSRFCALPRELNKRALLFGGIN